MSKCSMWRVYSKTGEYLGAVDAFYFWEVKSVFGGDIEAYKTCEHCGRDLVPGKNWFTGRGENVCTDCSPVVVVDSIAPKRASKAIKESGTGDYWHDRIMARQESSGMYD